jgi:uncharacterized protein (TIGR02145 family)
MRIKNLFVSLFILMVILVTFTGCDPNGLNPVGGNGSIKDYDGNLYDSVVIGNQVWMVQNLRVTHYRNGDKIPMQADNNKWSNTTVGAWCNYANSASNSITYGRLYNYNAVADTRGIAPVGWRVASLDDWKRMKSYLIKNGYNYNGDTISNKIAKSLAAQSSWEKFTGEGLVGTDLASNNKSGFRALPGGGRDETGFFGGIKRSGLWWTSTGYLCVLSYDKDSLSIKSDGGSLGFSVRCIKDNLSK